jgi:elongation factor 1 alpha-like protein
MSALQRLAASRKADQERAQVQQKHMAAEVDSTPPAKVDTSAKPLSKLAQLAAQRKAASNAGSSATVTPPLSVAVQTLPSKTPASTPDIVAESSSGKPVSKLAQRIAAAKAAKAQAEAENIKASAKEVENSSQPLVTKAGSMEIDVEDSSSPLFTFPSQLERNLPEQRKNTPTSVFFSSSAASGPSEFFTLLTTPPKTSRVVPRDPEREALAKRRRRSEPGKDPFEELDPDEAVMKAREGTRLAPGAVKRK